MKYLDKLSDLPEDTFSERLRKARSYSGLSQRELSKVCGVNPQTLGNWEAGRFHKYLTSISGVAEAIGCDLYWLLTGECKDEKKERNR